MLEIYFDQCHLWRLQSLVVHFKKIYSHNLFMHTHFTHPSIILWNMIAWRETFCGVIVDNLPSLLWLPLTLTLECNLSACWLHSWYFMRSFSSKKKFLEFTIIEMFIKNLLSLQLTSLYKNSHKEKSKLCWLNIFLVFMWVDFVHKCGFWVFLWVFLSIEKRLKKK